MNILIPTIPNDLHAITVMLALKKKGHHATLWYTADFPSQQKHSFQIDQNHFLWSATGKDFALPRHTFDVVWYRRPSKPVLAPVFHPDDLENSHSENMAFFKNFWPVIAPDAKWVNHWEAAIKAQCKLLQLKTATEIGFKIPPTLMSNDPQKIKQFMRTYPKNQVIYKTFHPHTWKKENSIRINYTRPVQLERLPADEVLQNTPGIFQRKIAKAFELRITCFGHQVFASQLDSQSHPRGSSDWRYIPATELPVKPFELPLEIRKKCLDFLAFLNLSFGCFDFIVTPQGDYYFLELNEQGQFLWVEALNPEVHLLEHFTNYLLGSSSSRSTSSTKISIGPVVTLASVQEEAELIRQASIQQHQDPYAHSAQVH